MPSLRLHWLSTTFLSFLLATGTVCAKPITIIAVGDVMLSGSGTSTYRTSGYDHPFKVTTEILRGGEVTIGNLEAPITENGQEYMEKQFRFRMDPGAAEALKEAGFDIVTLANNHMLDFGPEGLEDTLRYLESVGIAYTGAGSSLRSARKPALIRVNERKVAVLAYSMTFPVEFFATAKRPGTAPGDPILIAEDIAKARKEADIVIVAFHWGAEKSTTPKKYQIASAHAAIDAGADLIIGHHPHVLQGIESYRGKTILYSIGNFAFGCISPSCARSVIAEVSIDGDSQQVTLIPLDVLNPDTDYQPKILEGAAGRKVIADLNLLCMPLGTSIETKGSIYRLISSSGAPVSTLR
jgi:poly-gamma-glutamate synthesis protein (capsule biosynthesis protein)